MKHVVRTGLWWLPTDDSPAVVGTFTFSPDDGPRLQITGNYDDSVTWLRETKRHIPIVIGETDSGESITLADCMVIGSGLPELRPPLVIPGWVFIGLHCDDLQNLIFASIAVEFSGLREWSGSLPLTVDTDVDGTQINRYQVTFEKPDPITCETRVGEVSIDFEVDISNTSPDTCCMNVVPWFRIDSRTPKSIQSWIAEAVGPYQDLLTLGIDGPVHIESFIVFPTRPDTGEIHQPQNTRAVEVLFDPVVHSGTAPSRLRFGPLFTLADFDEKSPAIFEKWLTVHDSLVEVLGLFYLHRFRELFVVHEFMDVVTAIEAYHRVRFSNVGQDLEMHDKRRDEILRSAPHEHQEWLETVLPPIDEPRLRKRLKDVINCLGDVRAGLLGNKDHRSRFIHSVVSTRNSLAHPDHIPREGVVTGGDELYELIEKLSWILKVSLLREVGFSEERVTDIVSRNYGFRFAGEGNRGN